jgi:hypothetical protein
MIKPKVTFIICSKNDNWEGKPIERLRKSIEITCENTNNHDDYEILIGDWGSDIPIHEELGIRPKIRCTVLHIPQSVTSKFNVPISEVHCLNMLSRRANGTFVGRVDQDTITHRRFFDYVENNSLDLNGLYWSTRRDLPKDCFDYSKSTVGKPCHSGFFRAAIGIVMMSKSSWHSITGYDEKLFLRNHMEHDLFHRSMRVCSRLYNIGCMLDAPFYHIYHDRAMGKMTQSNSEPSGNFHLLPTKINDEGVYGLAEYDHLIEERNIS